MAQGLAHDELLEILEYDPATGKFKWKNKSHGLAKTGWFEGTKHARGYRTVRINGPSYLAHRLAWFYMTGARPKHEIDHKDRNRSNNVFENLREATVAENRRNSSLRSDNTSGAKGVVWSKDCSKWLAQIQIKGRGVFIGVFESKEDAARAYAERAKKEFGDFYHAARSL